MADDRWPSELEVRHGLSLVSLQARRGAAKALRARLTDVLDLDPPKGPRRVAAGHVACIGIGPSKWLVTREADEEGRLAAELAATLQGLAAVVDQSDAWLVARLAGPSARDALQKALPIDLHPRRFGPGDAACTVMARINVMLWQLDDRPAYEIATPRSYADSFVAALARSCAVGGLPSLPDRR